MTVPRHPQLTVQRLWNQKKPPWCLGNTQISRVYIREQQQRQDLLGLENEISYNQALIQEREQGIQEIETAMAEVHELFCDLGLLVSEQQGVLGKIIM